MGNPGNPGEATGHLEAEEAAVKAAAKAKGKAKARRSRKARDRSKKSESHPCSTWDGWGKGLVSDRIKKMGDVS